VINTDASITAICLDVGYSSMGTFTRRFTASVGVSPRQLRWFSQHRHDTIAHGLVSATVQPVGPGADIMVRWSGAADGTRIFVGVFPLPAPIGRPIACATVTETTGVVLPDVPAGDHYVLAATCPRDAAGEQFAGIGTIVGMADPAPIHSDGHSRQEVAMQLRPVEVTDPPIVSFLPLLFHESCMRSLRGDLPATVRRARRGRGCALQASSP
jgi:hypothetical protein